jgi:hypothetical protein
MILCLRKCSLTENLKVTIQYYYWAIRGILEDSNMNLVR